MFNKKYYFEKIEQFSGRYPWGGVNPVYEGMTGRICYPAYLNIGERGWILYELDDGLFNVPHRMHTSIIQNVEYTDDQIVITTENTKLTLRVFERQDIE